VSAQNADIRTSTDDAVASLLDGLTRRDLSVVVASDPIISEPPAVDAAPAPTKDYLILGRQFNATLVDPRVAVRSRLARAVARVTGNPTVVAYRAVRSARRSDALIAMGDDIGILTAAMKFLLRSRTPYVMICNHLRSRKARLLFGRLGLQRHVQYFLPCSMPLRELLIDEYGIEPDRIAILYNTVDHRFFDVDTGREHPRQIASAGLTLRDYKTLLEATRGLDADVKIEANSAWYDQPVNFAAEDVHDRVELCNDGTTAGLREIYATSAMVVVPLVEVGEPAGATTILEGMAMGKAVVASAIAMGSDYIRDGETGFLVPPGDADALRARIEQLLDEPDLRRRIGAAARQAVVAQFGVDHFAKVMLASVERVSSSPRR
jgi:glycosyltransferase involved in cell wall biosynthesis